MIKAQVYLPKKEMVALKELAGAKKVSYASLIRRGVEKVLSENKPERKKFDIFEFQKRYAVGMGGDVAKRIDDILYGKSK